MGCISSTSASVPENIAYQKGDLRISVILPRIIRIEKGSFTDLPTQTVWFRDHGSVHWQWNSSDGYGTLKTDAASFRIDLKKGKVLSVQLPDGSTVNDLRKGILPGTARTLDMVNGAAKLEKGILSRSGASILDDSHSLLLDGDKILPRPGCSDIYYFAYGKDHLAHLRDFFRITGPVPLVPKYALGNWWSRYKAYTQEEYRQLMQTFIDRNIPITVSTIDMDWHWVDVKQRFGKTADPGRPGTIQEVMYNYMLPGWTGYTWNTELFPDHQELLNWLHGHGSKVPLNVHPSQGIRAFESCYESVCHRLGTDPTQEKRIPFDITSEAFRKAYFEEVHRPLEKEGVDFWWIDWQQGKRTKVPGLDPLWALNHYHTMDMEAQGKRPLILSRYSGIGSHRYPLGFSGDSFCTWKSLAFQPYFTSTASNAGYTWWSHDIGGHQQGVQDDELYLRWLQFGVFSPVNRLHSSNSEFMGKEPWQRSWAVSHIAEEFLRLRHRMIPFLYSANYQTHKEGIPLCMPMYYVYDCDDAYKAKDQYIFGSQLLVCPITRPMDKHLDLAWADVWLPDGNWTDIFNGRRYKGGTWVRMYRDLDSIPVLARAGSIVPMYRDGSNNDLSLEQPLDIHVWIGNGNFSLYEDDGETTAHTEGISCITDFIVQEEGTTVRFTVTPPKDSKALLPPQRSMRICFRDIVTADIEHGSAASTANGHLSVSLTIGMEPVVVELKNVRKLEKPAQEAFNASLLTRYQGSNLLKSILFKNMATVPRNLKRAMEEYSHFQ